MIIREEKGASSLEFALVMPLLVLIIFGIIQFGIVYNHYLAITHAAREGARLAAVGKFSEEAVTDRAYPVDSVNVEISYPNGESHGEPVEVKVSSNYLLSIPLYGQFNIPLISKAEMRIEY